MSQGLIWRRETLTYAADVVPLRLPPTSEDQADCGTACEQGETSQLAERASRWNRATVLLLPHFTGRNDYSQQAKCVSVAFPKLNITCILTRSSTLIRNRVLL